MTVSTDVDVIQRSLQLLAAHRNELSAHFFGRLFGRHPELQAYFEDSNPEWLERKFAAALRSIMQAAASPTEFEQHVGSLRQAHQSRSVEARHFAMFADVLIESFAYYGGRGWTEEVEATWRSVLATVVEGMSSPQDAAVDSDAAKVDRIAV